jgi:hypothetical protein
MTSKEIQEFLKGFAVVLQSETFRTQMQGIVPPGVPSYAALVKSANENPVAVLMPPCADLLLSLAASPMSNSAEEIDSMFREYFLIKPHQVLVKAELSSSLDAKLANCMTSNTSWPSDGCGGGDCVTLSGVRNSPSPGLDTQSETPPLKRLFVGDAVWLFFMERMGIFEIIGGLCDSYASNGKLPIAGGHYDVTSSDSLRKAIAALILETMTRQLESGTASRVRMRAGTYRTALGWQSERGKELNLDTQMNQGFNDLFNKFMFHSLEYFRDRRLATAINSVATGGPSTATLVTIRDTLSLLKERFETFYYGRNYYNTLNGIVWVISGLSLLKELRTSIGIPDSFKSPQDYVPAAYNLLKGTGNASQGDATRYVQHKMCATMGRNILLDIEVLDLDNGNDLSNWLFHREKSIESYRTAYKALTGVDLGTGG